MINYKPFLLAILLSLPCWLFSQTQKKDTTRLFKPDLPVDVNFLFNYYEQDGIHSAVTGGEGTEELTDFSAKIVVNVPLDTLTVLHTTASINHYTSASTDKIDTYVSSASRQDSRGVFILGYDKKRLNGRQTWGLSGGGSLESDYISYFVSGKWAQISKDGNQELALQAQAFFDTWVVIFPEELRAPGLASVPTDKRKSFNLSATWSTVINTRLQASLSGEFVLQQGLLSTPFHRVYFTGETLPKIEKLPTIRIKYPLGMRVNYYAFDFLILRLYYRFYYDSFQILAHTTSIETPFKLGPFFSIYPFYRFHHQSASTYFAPFKEHSTGEEFYTSDYDLSGFYSQKYGMGLSLSPIYGIFRYRQNNGRTGMLKSIDLRYSNYLRSDGLKASAISLDFGFSF
ncbi:MAG: DUF3570 domain-containing protein [Bacteroidetes bacterium]|nr:DUF3570 domain-containing protein [Bacteroidota bacterium]